MIKIGKNAKSVVVDFLLTSKTETARIFLGLSSLIWALCLLWPGDMFDQFMYLNMAQFGTEFEWGAIFLFHAGLTLFNLCSKTVIPALFVSESILAFILCTIATVCVFLTMHQAPAVMAPHITSTLLSWWLLIRTGLTHGRFRVI